MREILFRGKRIDNGEWIEGFYHFAKWYLNGNFTGKITYYIRPIGAQDAYQVDPSTVGQYTGLTDKNGKRIFEGDILQTSTIDTNEERKALIGFGKFIDENSDDEYLGFYIEFCGIKTTITQLLLEEVKDRFEVIGNIHDNPELLEVSGDE